MECGESGKNGVTVVCHVAMAQEQDTENAIHHSMVGRIVKGHQLKQRVVTSILVLVSLSFQTISKYLRSTKSVFSG